MRRGHIIALPDHGESSVNSEAYSGKSKGVRAYTGTAEGSGFIEAGSLTSILNRMEEKGLIERRMLNGNRRTFHIFMTESGRKSQMLVEAAFVEIEENAWKDISSEEAETFMKIYHKIYYNLSETGCEETGKEGK